MGTHLRVLNESYPMNTNMIGFRRFSVLALWTKIASTFHFIETSQIEKDFTKIYN